MRQLRLLLLVLLSFVSKAINAYDFEDGNVYYQITSSTQMTCSVVNNGSDNSYSGDVVIPEKVMYGGNEYTVTGIEYAAFKNCIKLKSVSLSKTMAKIAHEAFMGCVLLKEFTVPQNVSSLQSSCFYGCISLEKVDLGNVKIIGSQCFKGCVSLENILISKNVSKIEGYAFCGCASLSSVTVEDSDETLTLGYDDHGGLFADCPLTNVYVGRNLEYTSADNYSDGVDRLSPFASNKTLKTITLGDNVTKVGKYFCYKCPMLELVSGMQNVTSLGDYAFYECTSIKNFVINDNVTSIGKQLLYGCTSLESLVVGNGVEDIGGGYLLYGCTSLKNLYFGKGIKRLQYILCNKGELSNANVYIFSDLLSEIYIYVNPKTGEVTGGIPTDVKAVYVANPERYETLLGKYYNVKPMLVFNENSLEYTGKTSNLSYRNNVEGMDVSFDNTTTPQDVGSYKTNIDVNFSNSDWSVSLEIPCEYTITKAPLAIIANDVQRYYKEENPIFTCSFIGFKNGETIENLDTKPTVYTTADVSSNVGTYPIYCSGAEARNYELNYKEGSLTILKAEQEIEWEQDFSDVTVGTECELTATTSSGLPIKYRSSDLSTIMISSKKGKQYAYMVKPGRKSVCSSFCKSLV